MAPTDSLKRELRTKPRRWVITGVAGFIGSHLLETLLRHDQVVVGLDNFATGHQRNLDHVQAAVRPDQWQRFRFVRGDITRPEDCQMLFAGTDVVDCVLHQAALGSVPRSLADPIATHQANVNGTLNMLVAARAARAGRFVYASSSSVYGDHPALPKKEETIGRPLSPYAASKLMVEIYAGVYTRCFDLPCVGLRYFNVFGPRQDPVGVYAAVIPRWIAQTLKQQAVTVNGDGETSRDFCYVDNVVQANLLAGTVDSPNALGRCYNVAAHTRTTLNDLLQLIQQCVRELAPDIAIHPPLHQPFRAGDVHHSLADISDAGRLLGYVPAISVDQGLRRTVEWFHTQRT